MTSWTDEQLEELSKRFESVYSQAASEMGKKLEKALSDYSRENEQRQKALDGSEESRKAYEDWKRGQAYRQEWVREMAQQMSEGAVHANMHAADMINDTIPHTYAESANEAAFKIEDGIGMSVGFTLVNEDAVRHLVGMPLREAGDDQLLREVTWTPEEARSHVQDLRKREVDYPKDMRWNRDRFHTAITQGILQGESIPNIVKRTKDIFGMNRNSAIRAARTATTNAENAGRMSTFERAQKLGIDMEIEWLAAMDGRTRSAHRELDGKRVKVGESFVNSIGSIRWPGDPQADAANIWNCFIGEMNTVPLGCIERSFRRFYNGDAITVKTASGVEFTCTPNHPILTSNGWVAAGLLDDGYDLFIADLGNAPRCLGIEPDVKHVGTRLDTIHELLDVNTSERASGVTVYFHEDIATRDVDVVGEKRSLRVNLDTLALEPFDELALEPSDTLASSDGTLMIRGITPMTPSDSIMSGSSKPRAFLGSGISHALEHGLRTVSGRDSSPLEPDIYDTSTDAEVLGKSLHALSAVIKLDHVVDVDIHPISAHVYNLQTESGAYLVNNNDSIPAYVIAHNCRCRANGRVVGFDGKRGDWADERGERWTRLPKGMTYDEWKTAKAVSRDKSYENESDRRLGYWPNSRPTASVEELQALVKRYEDEVTRLANDLHVPTRELYDYNQEYVDKYAQQMRENEWAKDLDLDQLHADVDRLYEEQSMLYDKREELRSRRRELRARYDEKSLEEYERLRKEIRSLGKKYDSCLEQIDDAYRKIDAKKTYDRAKKWHDEYKAELDKKLSDYNQLVEKAEEARRLLPEARKNRNRAYAALSEAQPFAPQVREALGDEYADRMRSMVDEAEGRHPEIAGLYKMFSSQLKIVEKDLGKGAFYRSSDRGIHFNAKNDAAGSWYETPYQTLFHEFGHLIDHVGGFGDRYTSNSGNLEQVIKKDWAAFRNAEGRRLGVTRNKNEAAIDMLKDEVSERGQLAYGDVSDIIEGCTKKSYPLGIGHGVSYHKRDGATEREFFAEVCDSAMRNEDSYEQMRRIFPHAVDLVEEMAREILGL